MTEEDGCLQEVSYGATSTTTEQRVSSQFRFLDVLSTCTGTIVLSQNGLLCVILKHDGRKIHVCL